MSLSHVRVNAARMLTELRSLPPQQPATVEDLISVYAAIEELAREASSATDPRLYVASGR